jgi:hypothetical protein
VRRSPRVHGCALGEHTAREEKGVSLVTFFAPAKKVTRSPQASETLFIAYVFWQSQKFGSKSFRSLRERVTFC